MIERMAINKNEDFFKQNTATGAGLPFSEDISVLGEKITIGKKTVQNRLVCQAMEGCDGTFDGAPDSLTIRRYHRFAEGGAGIIWFEATACCQEGRANPRQLQLTEKNADKFKKLVDEIREIGLKKNGFAPIIIMQNTHSGRYSKPNGVPEPIIAYNNQIFEKDTPIDKSCIISDSELDKVKENLVNSSVLAEKIGFDGVDIKCCHRYLNSELLSAYEREGKYGGSLENRTRLLRETIDGVKEVSSSDFIVTSRLNVYDGFEYPYGFGVEKDKGIEFDIKEPVWLLQQLVASGVNLVNITMGNPYFNPHVNRPFANGPYTPSEHPIEGVARMLKGIAELKKNVPELKMISSGLSYLGTAAPNVAAAFIKNGDFDFAGFGRMIFANPDFANQIIRDGQIDKKKICICCSKCTEVMRNGSTPGCVIRDSVYTDIYKNLKK